MQPFMERMMSTGISAIQRENKEYLKELRKDVLAQQKCDTVDSEQRLAYSLFNAMKKAKYAADNNLTEKQVNELHAQTKPLDRFRQDYDDFQEFRRSDLAPDSIRIAPTSVGNDQPVSSTADRASVPVSTAVAKSTAAAKPAKPAQTSPAATAAAKPVSVVKTTSTAATVSSGSTVTVSPAAIATTVPSTTTLSSADAASIFLADIEEPPSYSAIHPSAALGQSSTEVVQENPMLKTRVKHVLLATDLPTLPDNLPAAIKTKRPESTPPEMITDSSGDDEPVRPQSHHSSAAAVQEESAQIIARLQDRAVRQGTFLDKDLMAELLRRLRPLQHTRMHRVTLAQAAGDINSEDLAWQDYYSAENDAYNRIIVEQASHTLDVANQEFDAKLAMLLKPLKQRRQAKIKSAQEKNDLEAEHHAKLEYQDSAEQIYSQLLDSQLASSTSGGGGKSTSRNAPSSKSKTKTDKQSSSSVPQTQASAGGAGDPSDDDDNDDSTHSDLGKRSNRSSSSSDRKKGKKLSKRPIFVGAARHKGARGSKKQRHSTSTTSSNSKSSSLSPSMTVADFFGSLLRGYSGMSPSTPPGDGNGDGDDNDDPPSDGEEKIDQFGRIINDLGQRAEPKSRWEEHRNAEALKDFLNHELDYAWFTPSTTNDHKLTRWLRTATAVQIKSNGLPPDMTKAAKPNATEKIANDLTARRIASGHPPEFGFNPVTLRSLHKYKGQFRLCSLEAITRAIARRVSSPDASMFFERLSHLRFVPTAALTSDDDTLHSNIPSVLLELATFVDDDVLHFTKLFASEFNYSFNIVSQYGTQQTSFSSVLLNLIPLDIRETLEHKLWLSSTILADPLACQGRDYAKFLRHFSSVLRYLADQAMAAQRTISWIKRTKNSNWNKHKKDASSLRVLDASEDDVTDQVSALSFANDDPDSTTDELLVGDDGEDFFVVPDDDNETVFERISGVISSDLNMMHTHQFQRYPFNPSRKGQPFYKSGSGYSRPIYIEPRTGRALDRYPSRSSESSQYSSNTPRSNGSKPFRFTVVCPDAMRGSVCPFSCKRGSHDHRDIQRAKQRYQRPSPMAHQSSTAPPPTSVQMEGGRDTR
jgi:hypothetical protein